MLFALQICNYTNYVQFFIKSGRCDKSGSQYSCGPSGNKDRCDLAIDSYVPSRHISLKTNRYYYLATSKDWPAAQAYCETSSKHLATFTTDNHWEDLKYITSGKKKCDAYASGIDR